MKRLLLLTQPLPDETTTLPNPIPAEQLDMYVAVVYRTDDELVNRLPSAAVTLQDLLIKEQATR